MALILTLAPKISIFLKKKQKIRLQKISYDCIYEI